MTSNQCLIVLGMHRSGTSALTGTLALMGIETGSNLMPPDERTNPKGFWENAEIVSINDRLLEAIGSSWHDARKLPNKWWKTPTADSFRDEILQALDKYFNKKPLWVLKDPRMCRLLPLWIDVFNIYKCRPQIIISLRNPLEVAHSLHVRDGISLDRASLLWLTYMLEAEYWTREENRIFVDYKDLLTDWVISVSRVSHKFNLDLNLVDTVKQANVNKFLNPALRHHSNTTMPSDVSTPTQLAIRCYDTFLNNEPPNSKQSVVEEITTEVASLISTVTPWEREIQDLRKYNEQLQNAKNDLDHINNHPVIGRICKVWRKYINPNI